MLASSGCADRPESDQIAQHSMIGLPKRTILACMGEPTRRDVVGSTQIWTYPVGEMRTNGAPWAIGLNLGAPPFGPSGPCNVKVVLTNAKVTQVTYTAANGGDLPLGQQCVFAVRNCAPTF
ncbi:MAG: hypothetical protein JO107_06565 [Hyphomicrobiales bacterium]|nr:hypothetical protein [Hyphomicrobiales bacterium]MBV8662748.1 hypothetical protein [Hyphomicrobiales bacterium]